MGRMLASCPKYHATRKVNGPTFKSDTSFLNPNSNNSLSLLFGQVSCVMGEQEDEQLLLFESLLQKKYYHMIRVHAPILTPPKDDSESSETEQKSEYPGLKNSEFSSRCSQTSSTPDSSNIEPTKKYSERDEDEAETTSGEADDQSKHAHEETRDSLEGEVINFTLKDKQEVVHLD